MDFAHKIGTTMNLFNSFQIFTPTTGESPGSFPGQIVPKIAQNVIWPTVINLNRCLNTINGLYVQDRDHCKPFQQFLDFCIDHRGVTGVIPGVDFTQNPQKS